MLTRVTTHALTHVLTGTTQRTEIMHDTEESNYSPAIRVGDYKLLNSLSKNKNLNNSAPVWALHVTRLPRALLLRNGVCGF